MMYEFIENNTEQSATVRTSLKTFEQPSVAQMCVPGQNQGPGPRAKTGLQMAVAEHELARQAFAMPNAVPR